MIIINILRNLFTLPEIHSFTIKSRVYWVYTGPWAIKKPIHHHHHHHQSKARGSGGGDRLYCPPALLSTMVLSSVKTW